MPAVYYGPKTDSTSISVKKNDFIKLYHEAGESTVVMLKGEKDVDVLIHDVTFHPVSEDPIHIDFFAIDKDAKVQVNVPLEFIGEAPAAKLGGNIMHILHEIEVKAKPADLPQSIEVDMTLLVDMSSTITVGDLKVPTGVEFTAEPTETVATVVEAKEEEDVDAEAIDMETIGDAEDKGKSEEAAEEGGE